MALLFTEDSWKQYLSERNASLKEEHGWLSLVSFTWISDEPAHLGDFPGVWQVNNGKLFASFHHVDFSAGHAPVLRDGEPFAGEAQYELREGESCFDLSFGTSVAEIAMRGGRYCVRVRDAMAPTRRAFTAVPTFPFYPRAVVRARFISYGEPLHYMGRSARKGVPAHLDLVGDLEFGYDVSRSRLAVTGDPHGELTLAFYDPTNGEETAAWRGVHVLSPQALRATGCDEALDLAEDECIIDFNRAWNWPCAFTPFGTCPKPIDSNVIPVPVHAGELRPEPWINPEG